MSLHDYSTTFWSVLPPLLALTLAIVTKRVLFSLSLGIIIGALMLTDANILNSALYIITSVISLVYDDGAIAFDNVNIIIFLFLLGVLTSLLTISGSNQAFALWAQKRIKSKRGSKLLTVLLGIFIFIDDYFNSLAVGAVARPVTDKFKVSRAKLAYLLDSTAAPVCVMMPISSWGAYIITLIAGLLATHTITEYTPIGAFMTMVSMNYYAIFSIVMVLLVAYFSFDIGSMAKFEEAAEKAQTIVDNSKIEQTQGKVSGLIVPILSMIVATITAMILTGAQGLAAEGKAFSILGAFENTVVGLSLVIGGLTGVSIATLYVLASTKITTSDYAKAWIIGLKSMAGAVTILFFAWTINTVVGDMQTGKFLSSLVSENMSVSFLPVVLFILSAMMAFATGTSWGTFGIMLPIAAAIAAHTDPSLILPCMSAVMAGAVFGDHCSPVSDTTILSSTGAGCNHIDHVTTQLPYALLVAISSALGFLVLGFTRSIALGFMATLISILVLIFLLRHKMNSSYTVEQP